MPAKKTEKETIEKKDAVVKEETVKEPETEKTIVDLVVAAFVRRGFIEGLLLRYDAVQRLKSCQIPPDIHSDLVYNLRIRCFPRCYGGENCEICAVLPPELVRQDGFPLVYE